VSQPLVPGTDPAIEISVVVPVYKCAPCLLELHRRLRESLSPLADRFEMVFVEDRGPDGSWEMLVELARADPCVRAVRLSRNFGQHAAITAGLVESRGRFVVVMDCDLQDPPEEIGRLYAKAREGYDVVLARRIKKRQALHRRLAAGLYFALLNRLAGLQLDGEFGSFSILSRKVVEGFLRFRDRDRHYLLILNWLGFRTGEIDYEHASRAAGKSSYTLRRLIVHALNGIFAQTTVFLRWIVYLGFAVCASGLVLAAFFVYTYFAHDTVPAGFTSLAVLVLVIGGFGILTTGVSGLYVGKIFDQVRERPLFVVDERVGPE
jgi:polyisoprenyl-phosphate glycosyltransferase